jgi:hypothetical protein
MIQSLVHSGYVLLVYFESACVVSVVFGGHSDHSSAHFCCNARTCALIVVSVTFAFLR